MRFNIVKVFLMLIFSLLAFGGSAIVHSSDNPPIVNSEYFKTIEGGFVAQYDHPEVKYGFTLSVVRPIPPDSTVVAEFENPLDSAQPFVMPVDYKDKTTLIISSPTFEGVRNRTNYKVVVSIRAPDGSILSTHTQHVRFELPDAVIKKAGIKTL